MSDNAFPIWKSSAPAGFGLAIAALLAVTLPPVSDLMPRGRARLSESMALPHPVEKPDPPVPKRNFKSAGDFSQGLAPVQIGSAYGFIDSTGVLRIPARFAYAGGFSGNRAPVLRDGRWGYLDATGSEAIPAVYGWAGAFREGLAPVAGPEGYGFIDTNGARVGAADFTDARAYSEGLAAVRVGEGENAAWGFVDRSGALAIPPLFPDVPRGFSEGLAAVRMESERPFRSGYIDSSGGFAIDTLYDAAGDFHEGLAPVGKGDWRGDRFRGVWGYADRTGRLVTPLAYSQASAFEDGRALVRLEGSGYRVIGTRGEILASFPDGFEIACPPRDGMVTFKSRGRFGFLDSSGAEIVPPIFTEAGQCRQGWARARIGTGERGAWVFIDRRGRFLGDRDREATP